MTYSRVALSIGINKYLNYPDATLGGCVQDAQDFHQFLIDRLQMNYDNTTLLMNDQATWRGTDQALTMMLEYPSKLEKIFFSSSGHGTTAPNPEEPDGQEGALVMYDTQDLPIKEECDPATLYTESWFMSHLAAVPSSCLFEAVLDHCFVGEFAEKSRFIRPRAHFLSRFLRVRPETVVIWASCGPRQTSAEYYLDGHARGAFTWAFIKSYDPGMNRMQLINRIANLLASEGFEQRPMLLCSDRLAGLPMGEI